VNLREEVPRLNTMANGGAMLTWEILALALCDAINTAKSAFAYRQDAAPTCAPCDYAPEPG
jgi:hypothetical protein